MQASFTSLTSLQVSIGLLAQLDPPAGIETLIYQVPLGNRTFISEISVCNRSGGGNSFKFSISKGGAATTTKDYLYFSTPINAHDTFASEIGVTLSASDTIRVVSTSGSLTFTIFGMNV